MAITSVPSPRPQHAEHTAANIQSVASEVNLREYALIKSPLVYFICDGDTVVYVGQTVNLPYRLMQHAYWVQNHVKDLRVRYIEVPASEMNRIERHWIRKLQPKFNLAYTEHGAAQRMTGLERDNARAAAMLKSMKD